VTPDELLTIGDRVIADARSDESVECVIAWSTDTEVRAYEGEIEAFTSANAAGVGVRVVAEGRQGFAYCGTLEEADVRAALADARDNATFATPDPHAGVALPDGVALPALDLVDDRLSSFPTESKLELALELDARVRSIDPRIFGVESIDYADGLAIGAVVSTAGIRTASMESAASLVAYVLAADGDDVTTGFGFSVGRHPESLDVERCARDAVARAVRMIGAAPMATERLTVILDPWVTAQFIGIVADVFSADSVIKGRSLFAERLGETVAAPCVTLTDDASDPRQWGATESDAEGLATRRTDLITAGVASAFLHDSHSARMMGTVSTGSAVRHGYMSTPSPGAQAVLLQPGAHSPEELLALVGDGVLVQDVSGMHSGVNPVSGDFSTGIEGVRIRGGELAEPVREVTIGSTLQRMLGDVVAVGDDLEFFPMEAAGVSLAIADVTISGQER